MFWELARVVRNRYQGCRKFRQATGKWPVFTVLADIFSVPVLLAIGTYLVVATFRTGRLPLIYAGLFTVVFSSAAVWYGLPRLACKVDAARAKRSSETRVSADTLEQLIR
jgi:small-conductance mechanosensitive channel